ncbi:peptide chain release factor N(5)-glutamine methyltransferase [Mesoplasma syrphidae]|uniref:Peptide chain release factor N(5)-glutamine methyltransferase n=1 Tax=Mesoplasma syrphidae TaxID=225999 RepID=A0A2K9BML4_9MOLU|nr:peptide chain release factor N(5)-glutamine methyltransferase [Mesoplasma syrphidae]AUF83283.1 peptide chain release factor N(5)-glutamine methyltransferase [Mesoplasma syrphidae]
MSHKVNFTIRDLYYKFMSLNISLKKADVYQILEYLLKMDYSDIISNLEFNVEIDEEKIRSIITDLQNQKPLGYILKYQFFYKRKFYIDNRVLIPRSDTEILIDVALKWIKYRQNILIADICTGSGTIGITLNLETNNPVICTDISEEALTVAKINSQNLQANNTKFYLGNFLNPLIERNLKVNLLISNPPYIDCNDQDISSSVKNFEPHLALYADNNGLWFYQNLVDNLNNIVDLNEPFAVIMEFGWKQKNQINQILKKSKIKIAWEFIRDYSGNWRCVIITNG